MDHTATSEQELAEAGYILPSHQGRAGLSGYCDLISVESANTAWFASFQAGRQLKVDIYWCRGDITVTQFFYF